MDKKVFLTRAEALREAESLAASVNGHVSDKTTSLSNGNDVITDNDCSAVVGPWSGEVSAVDVLDDDYNTIACYGWHYLDDDEYIGSCLRREEGPSLAALAVYDRLNGGNLTPADLALTESVELAEGAMLYIFGRLSAWGALHGIDPISAPATVQYPDGTVLVLRDWQGWTPHNAEDVADADWCTADGRDAVMLNGLPRLPLF